MSKTAESKQSELVTRLLEENRFLKNELELLKSELDNQPFAKARAMSRVGYWSYSYRDNKIVYSDEVYKIFEVPKTTDLSNYRSITNFFHPQNQFNIVSKWRDKVKTENLFQIDIRIIVPDGSIKFVTICTLVERDKNHQPLMLSGTITDNSENVFKSEVSKSNEELFRNLFTNLTDIFIIFESKTDSGGTITDYIFKDVNPTFEMKFNIKKEKITGTLLSLHPALFQQFNPLLKLTSITNEPQQDRLFIQSFDSFYDVLIYSPSENLIATLWRDVSLIVESDSALRESEEKYRQIFSIGNDALFMVDYLSGKILDLNPVAANLFGYHKDHIQKITFKQLSKNAEKFEKMILEQKSNLISEEFKRSDGTIFPAEVSLSYFNWGGRRVLMASLRDISERINTQEELVKSEKKYKHLFNYSNEAILIIKNYRIIDFNQKSCSLFLLKEEELINKTLWGLSPLKQPGGDDSRSKAVEQIQNALLGEPLQFEWVFQKMNRSTFFADLKIAPIIYGNDKVVQVILRDISPQKESQRVLKASVERWKASLEFSFVGVWDWNIHTNEAYFSSVWKKMLGYEKDEIPNHFEEFENRIHPSDLAFVSNSIDDYLSSKITDFQIYFRLRCKNGTYKWIQSQGKIFSYDREGKPERFIGTHIDITKQKITEENFNNEKENLRFATENANLGYWELNIRTMVITGSVKAFELIGYKNTNQLSLRQVEQLIHPEDQKVFISQFISSGIPESKGQTFRINIAGETKYIFSRPKPLFDTKNILSGYKGFFQDVTPFKKQELQVRNEQIILKSFTEKIDHAILIAQKDDIIYLNNKFSELTGYSLKEIYAQKITPFQIIVPEDRISFNKIIDAIQKNPSFSEKTDIRIETKNNRIKWAELFISSVDINNESAFLYVLVDITQRKLREIELTTRERQLKAILSTSNIGYALMNDKGQIFFNNKAFYLITGIDSTGTKIKSFDTFLDSEISKEISKGIETITFKIAPFYTNQFPLSNEKMNWVKLNVFPVTEQQNSPDYYIIFLEDIDKQKKKLLDLENNLFFQKIMLENSGNGIGLIDDHQILFNGNKNLYDLLNLNSKQKEPIVLSEIPFLKDFLSHTKTLINDKILSETIVLPDQKRIHIEMYPSLSENIPLFVIIARDITQMAKEQEELRLKIETFEGIFEKAPVGIALIDKNRNIILHNPLYARILEFSPRELTMRKLDELVTLAHLDDTLSKFSHLFTGLTQYYTQNLQMTSKNGVRLWICSYVSTLKDQFGDTMFAVQIISDNTESKTEEHNSQKRKQLRILQEVAQNFGDKFNDIFLQIYGNSFLLKNNLSDTRMAEYARMIADSVSRASDLTMQLLAFSKGSNQISVPVSVDEFMYSLPGKINLPAGLKIKNIPSPSKEIIIGNPAQLQLAFQNVIQNAADAMHDNGEITIVTSPVYFEQTFSKNNLDIPGGKYLRFSISDTGTGISQNDLNKIFDPFFSTKPKKTNAGLGLTIARQIIDLHKGTIKAISKVNHGTSINIYLPIPDPEKTESIVRPDEQMIVKGAANIMLIDDEAIVRSITSELLNELGYDVFCFNGDPKTLVFFQDHFMNIDLVMIDQNLGNRKGSELYQQMKKINPDMKVVFLFENTLTDNTKEFITSNLVGIIQKPVSTEKLLTTISKVLYPEW